MLDSEVVNSSFVKSTTAVRGFDSSAVNRWQELLHPLTKRWFTLSCGRRLQELSYPLDDGENSIAAKQYVS